MFPLTRISLSQQVIDQNITALEHSMKIKAMENYQNSMGVGVGSASSSGELAQVHNKLATITERLQDTNVPKAA